MGWGHRSLAASVALLRSGSLITPSAASQPGNSVWHFDARRPALSFFVQQHVILIQVHAIKQSDGKALNSFARIHVD